MSSNSSSSPQTLFALPPSLITYLQQIDTFITSQIIPLQNSDDNNRFFDHRREYSRTDWENGGTPHKDWEELLEKARVLADEARIWRFALPVEFGGMGGGNLDMAVLRMGLTGRGLGLHCDLQNEWSIVGNFPDVLMVREFGTPAQKEKFIHGRLSGRVSFAFGLTEPGHGSDATHMSTFANPHDQTGVKGWLINGEKMWISGMHRATHCLVFARTSGKAGDAKGITAFFVERGQDGFKIEGYEWTFNMPTDHARLSLRNVFVPEDAVLGQVGEGLSIAQCFVHENRIRQAASSLGAAQYCIEQSILYSRQRKPFGKPLSVNQAIQFPIVELSTQCEMLKLLILQTASEMDACRNSKQIEEELGHKVSMCNYWANRLCCEAADRAIQIHGAVGYSRRLPFEHIYRHHIPITDNLSIYFMAFAVTASLHNCLLSGSNTMNSNDMNSLSDNSSDLHMATDQKMNNDGELGHLLPSTEGKVPSNDKKLSEDSMLSKDSTLSKDIPKSNKPGLLNLPREVIQHIDTFLDPPSSIALSLFQRFDACSRTLTWDSF